MIIWGSINCPTIKVFHRLLFYLREATSESYGPRGLFSIILLLFSFAFAFDLKISDLNLHPICNNFPSPFPSFISPSRDWHPLIALGCGDFFCVCRYWTRGVARTSFRFDTLVLNRGKYFFACYIIPSSLGNHQREHEPSPSTMQYFRRRAREDPQAIR